MWQELLKSTLKFENLIMTGWLDTGSNLNASICIDGRFEPSTNSGRSLVWAYKLKALKSSS